MTGWLKLARDELVSPGESNHQRDLKLYHDSGLPTFCKSTSQTIESIFREAMNMKKSIRLVVLLKMAALFLTGCGQRPDTDVTSSPKYNFSSFAGTMWKTKVKVGLIESKRYTNERVLNLFPPEVFDPTHPEYRPVHDMKIIAVLPVGAVIRIGRLMQDNGVWGGVWVTATIENGTNYQKTIYVSPGLLARNRFVGASLGSSTNWGVAPEMLEEAKK